MRRPQHLPDYTKPPLDEVVLGVQFNQIPGYSSVFANEVWSLFQPSHPMVSEQPMLPPNFETFGGGNPQPSMQLQMGPAPVGSRLWLATSDGNDLIQFQADRFISNWRKQPKPQDYPRFEGIVDAFEGNLISLRDYCSKRFNAPLAINQAEISYINIIPVGEFSEVGKWLRLWGDNDFLMENLNINFDEIATTSEGKPYARLKHHIRSVFTPDGSQKAFRLSLTFIGKPTGNSIEDALSFICQGRERIVSRFGIITTDEAQNSWGKVS